MRRTTILAVLTMLATLIAAPNAPVAHAADTVYTADFEPNGSTITADNFITNQYPFLTFDSNNVFGAGWNFSSTVGDGVLYQTSYENPIVRNAGQHGGSYSGEVDCPAEFCGHGTYGFLNDTADSIAVYAGDAVGSSYPIELDAYDSAKHLVGQDEESAPSAGAQKQLTVTAGAGQSIAYFTIYQVGGGGGTGGSNFLYIDDLSISVPPTVTPMIGVTAPASSYELGQGGTIHIPLTIQRINGASAAATVDVQGATSGVTGSASDPGTGTSSTLTVSATNTAPVGATVPLSVSASASGATSEDPITINIQVTDPILAFTRPTSLSPRTCSSKQFQVEAQLAPGEPTGDVGFATSFYPSTTGLTSDATTPAPVSNGLADTEVTLTSTGGGVGTTLHVGATLSNGAYGQTTIPIGRLGPEITSAGPLNGKLAHTQQAQGNGTTLEIYAHGVCDTATVEVGNSDATAPATVQHLTGNQGAYDYLRIQTPRLATSGPLAITTGSPPVTGDASPGVVAVDSYRNTNGWNFKNFDANITWDDMVEAFGDNQTYFQVDPCAAATLGAAHCPADVFPDPSALAWWGIAAASLEGGTCFGMSFATQRILEGLQSLKALDGTATTIFSAAAPDVSSSAQGRHGLQPVLDYIKATHLMQLSTEFIGGFLGNQLNASLGFTDAGSLAHAVSDVLNAGRFPIIQLVDGTGHILVAYDIRKASGGGYDIYVYDVNEPFTSDEQPETKANVLPSGDTHRDRLQASIIHLTATGDWSLASTTEKGGNAFNGQLVNINVFDPKSLPLHPTLGSASSGVNGLTGLLANSGGSGGNALSAATITQVSGGGKTLYGSGGGLNTNKNSRLDAAPFSPIVGSSGGRVPQLVALGGGVHDVTVSTTGTSSGPAPMTFLQGGYVGEIDASTSHGAKQQDSFSSSNGTAGYSGTTSKPVGVKVVDTLKGSARSVDVHFGSGGKGDDVTLGGNGAVLVAHSGKATSYTLTFSGGGGKAMPGTFTTGPLHIGAGKKVKISKIRWSALGSSRMRLHLGGHSVTVRNHSKRLRSPKITKLTVKRRSHHRLGATLRATLPKLSRASRVSVVWTLSRGQHVLRKHIADLAANGRHLHQSWQTTANGKHLKVTATVVAFAVSSVGESASVASRSKAP